MKKSEMWIRFISNFESQDGIQDLLLLFTTQIIVEWQADQLIADPFGDWTITGLATKTDPHIRKVEWQVMENTVDPVLLQVGDQPIPELQIGHQHVEHMVRLLAILWHLG